MTCFTIKKKNNIVQIPFLFKWLIEFRAQTTGIDEKYPGNKTKTTIKIIINNF